MLDNSTTCFDRHRWWTRAAIGGGRGTPSVVDEGSHRWWTAIVTAVLTVPEQQRRTETAERHRAATSQRARIRVVQLQTQWTTVLRPPGPSTDGLRTTGLPALRLQDYRPSDYRTTPALGLQDYRPSDYRTAGSSDYRTTPALGLQDNRPSDYRTTGPRATGLHRPSDYSTTSPLDYRTTPVPALQYYRLSDYSTISVTVANTKMGNQRSPWNTRRRWRALWYRPERGSTH
ncbi:uncharacterized protein LOC122369697 [Amphibalanus amphitrite]|uniref:uncharacterized protein LOC122369697 n=1 Tax=Amphibalanus amphitrite TaxID=1232801 RepID=UPI001C91D72F|nr:uncharacterized protein LOC122369697 [Amphibalanus amphitrite]